MADSHTVTRLLHEWIDGRADAFDEVLPLIYDELRRIAGAYMAREDGAKALLQPTALINEAYLRLVDTRQHPASRAHFFALAAKVMRHVLVDHARHGTRLKRGGGMVTLPLEDVVPIDRTLASPDEMLAIDQALGRFKVVDGQRFQVLELYVYGGLTQAEIAEALSLTPSKVHRDLTAARAWIRRALRGSA